MIAKNYEIGYNPEAAIYLYDAYSKMRMQFKDIHGRMNSHYNYTVSHLQWDAEQKEYLESLNRPANAYNLIAPVLRNIASMERGSRKKIMVLPRTEKDVIASVPMNYTLEYFHKKAKADYYISRAHLDAIIAMYSFVYQYWGYEDEEDEGKLFYKAINPMSVMFELRDSVDTTLSNCNLVMTESMLSLEEILEMYAFEDEKLATVIIQQASNYLQKKDIKLSKLISENIWRIIDSFMEMFTPSANDTLNRNIISDDTTLFDSKTNRFKVVEAHERRREKRILIHSYDDYQYYDITDKVRNETGRIENELIDNVRRKHFKDSSDPKPVLKKGNWITSFVPGLEIILQNEHYPVKFAKNDFMLTMIPAYDYHQDISLMQSVVSELIDPQTDYNKRRSTSLELLIRYIRRGYIAEEDAIEDYLSDFEDNKYIKRVKRNKLNSIKPEEIPNVTGEIIRDQEESKYLIDKISQVPPVLEGLSDSSQQSGRKYIAMKEQAEKNHTMLFDNLNTAKLIMAEKDIRLIQANVSEELHIRINEDVPDEMEFLAVNQQVPIFDGLRWKYQKLNDISVGKFDLVISNSPYGSNAREIDYLKKLDYFELITKLDPALALKLLPLLLKSADTSDRNEWITVINEHLGVGKEEGGNEEMQQLAAMVQGLDLESKQLDNEEKKIGNKKKMLDLIDQIQNIKGKRLDQKGKELEIDQMLNQLISPNSIGGSGITERQPLKLVG